MPKVTAVITTFNRERFLSEAIRSVLNQTFRDLELLILDNSSPDGTERVVEGFVDSRIRYIKHPPLTIAQQRNLGLQEAAGEYIAFLDDDDEWLPRKVERELEVFEKACADLGLVYGGFTRIDSEGKEFAIHVPVLNGRILTDLLWQKDAFTGSASNPMMRTSVLRALAGYNDALCTSEDWELYLRLAEQYRIEYTPDIVVRIRSHRGPRLGDRITAALEVEEMVLKRYGQAMDSRLKSFYLQKIGGKFCRMGLSEEGRMLIRQAIRTNPRNALAYIQYALSFTGSRVFRRVHWCYKRFL